MRSLFILVLLAGCYAPLDLPRSTGGSTSSSDASVDCSQYSNAAACESDPACKPQGCDECGEVLFLCAAADAPSPDCPAIPCVADCSQRASESDCAGDVTCVAVYDDPGTCDCAGPGCCMVFSRCVQGPPDCDPNGPSCSFVPIVCGDDYEPVVEDGCVSGCVKVSSCAMPD